MLRVWKGYNRCNSSLRLELAVQYNWDQIIAQGLPCLQADTLTAAQS